MDGDRVEDALDRLAADLAGRDRIVGHRLEDLERVAVRAAVLVNRHRGVPVFQAGMWGRTGRLEQRARPRSRRSPPSALLRARRAGRVRADADGHPVEHQRRRQHRRQDRHRDHRAGARPQGPDHPPAPGPGRQPARRPHVHRGAAQRRRLSRRPATSATSPTTSRLTVLGFLPVDQTVNGNLYNVVPHAGEPARFGIVLNAARRSRSSARPCCPPIILQSAASLRPSDLGLDSVLTDLPNTATVGRDADRDRHQLAVADPLRDGRQPAEGLHPPADLVQGAHGRLRRDGLRRPDRDAASRRFTTTNCAALPFTPELSASIKQDGGRTRRSR